MTLDATIRAAAARWPSASAVTGDRELTYAELVRLVSARAADLRRRGVSVGDPVGVCLDRGADLIITVLAVMTAGGVYTPLDPRYPAERLRYMVEDSGAQLIVAEASTAPLLGDVPAEVMLDPQGDQAEAPVPELHGVDDLAYMIYTSGSTGLPKGVEVEHRAIMAFAESQVPYFRLGPGDRVLQLCSPSFDVFMGELSLALTSGAALHCVAADQLLPGPELLTTLESGEISFVVSPATTIASIPWAPLPRLRHVVCGGEPLAPEVVSRWTSPRRIVYNAYGPTETTVYVSIAACAADGRAPDVGTPLPGADFSLAPAADEFQGRELLIAGAQLARGYRGRPADTAEAFVTGPDGVRRYRSGDLFRARADGAFEFVGRRDSQVKVRGHRIELGEVEAALGRHPHVGAAAARVVADGAGNRIVGYVTPADGDVPLVTADVLASAAQVLPAAAVPVTLVVLDRLPLGPTGKLDRDALPLPARERPDLPYVRRVPTSPLEQCIVAAYESVLGFGVGADDDLVDLGGDSLCATRIAAVLYSDDGLDVAAGDVLAARTPARLALRILTAAAIDDDALDVVG
jgi:amino acid adenylation domain-containing protein